MKYLYFPPVLFSLDHSHFYFIPPWRRIIRKNGQQSILFRALLHEIARRVYAEKLVCIRTECFASPLALSLDVLFVGCKKVVKI